MVEEISSIKKMRKLRLIEILVSRSINPMDMADILRRDGVISDKDFSNVSVSQNKAEDIFRLLENAKKSNVIDLLDYEWQVLPSQKLCLTIVTPSGIREFRHEES